MSTSDITQTVTGDRNIFTGTGDVTVVYNLPQADAEDRRGLLILLDRVKQFWIEGVLEQSVHHEALINLGKEIKADAVEHPWEQVVELPNAASQRMAPDTRVADVFEQVGRLLLILGEPGSGKTVTLLELARDLVARARSDPSQPVPVILNLSSWNEKFKSLSDWVTEELNKRYLIPKRIGRSWVDGNRLLLLLDGLDEVQADRRATCIRAINTFLENQGTPGLAVCSRLQEYIAEPVRLKMSGAICLQSLTATQIETYLSRLGSQLDALLAALNKDDVLRDLAKSPLMLSVMTLAYQGASAGAFSTGAASTAGARRRQIFDVYIDRMLARKGRSGSGYDKRQVIGWLAWLAWNLRRHGQAVFVIEQLQPSWLTCVRHVFAYLLFSRLGQAIAMLGVSIALWVPLQIAGVKIPIPDDGWGVWSILCVVGGFWSLLLDFEIYSRSLQPSLRLLHYFGWLAVGTICWGLGLGLGRPWERSIPTAVFGSVLSLRPYNSDIRMDPFIWSWKSVSTAVLRGLPVHATIIIMLSLIFTLLLYLSPVEGKLLGGILVVTFYAIFVALPLCLFGGFMSLDNNEIYNGLIKMKLKMSVLSGALICVPSIAAVLILLWFDFIQPFAGLHALSFLLIFGILVGISFGGLDVLRHYALRLIAIHVGYMPRRYAHFLEHCSKLVFLRRIGGGYIFIHRMLLEHFASMWEGGEEEGKSVSVGSSSATAHADIFLSYAREDAPIAQRLARALEDEGWSVWWDRHIPAGKTFDEVIREELAAARCVIVLWSKTSVESKWVKIEAHDGSDRGILIPVALITDMEMLPLAFRSEQTVSLVGWKGEKSHPGYQSLVAAVSNLF